uniref:Uncharacterized protein n=1 Tax=Heterorhabditis bacteriophora TaxID=37862 RepID=A0A1I7WQV1_HETBA
MPENNITNRKTTNGEKKLKPCCACPETKRFLILDLMHIRSDGNAQEAHVLHQEILRLDAVVKKKIDVISTTKDERSLLDETKQTRECLATLRSKIEQLYKIGPMLLSRREQQNVNGYVERHQKELEENIRQMRLVAISTSKKISEFTRTSLMQGKSGEFERRKIISDKNMLRENAEKVSYVKYEIS